jgi:SAM-dependent methyltransferase
MSRLYSFDLYWHTRQQLKQHPTIEHRSAYDRSDGRLDYWLGLIQRYAPSQGPAVEVGCAHGVLLAELRTRGYTCIGVEPDARTAEWTRQRTGLDIRSGFFPQVDLPTCDLFLAFDVIEHSPDPEAFMIGATKVTRRGGVAIVQTPIAGEGPDLPFGDMFEKVFDDVEHLYIFSEESLHRLAELAGFRLVTVDRWRLAHEILTLERR